MSLKSYSGFADYEFGWNRGAPFRVFFCGQFDTAFSGTNGGTFNYPYDPTRQMHISNPILNPFSKTPSVNGTASVGVGVLFTWEGNSSQTIESRIGLSFISEEKACNFMQSEVPWTQTFNETVDAAKKLWNGMK
jgi:hypothetical protein